MYVLMIVPSNFPEEDAGAIRDMAFAKIYQDLGYDVYLIGAGQKKTEGCYEGVCYYSVYRNVANAYGHFRRFLSASSDYNGIIEYLIKEHGIPSIIHFNSIPERTIRRIVQLAKRYKFPAIHDSTEWYSACEFQWGKFDKAYIIKDRLNRKVIKRPVRVIGISSYLSSHFRNRGLDTIRIPVILDVINTPIAKNDSQKINIVYAGSPGKKDLLSEIVHGAERLTTSEKGKLVFHIVGVDEKQLIELTGLKSIPSYIKVYGRIEHKYVEEIMSKMDFSVLLRPSNERYTKAGFPTKVVEAMSHGVAMICNMTSDLDLYLEDGKNAIIVDSYSAEDFSKGLAKVLNYNKSEISIIKTQARITAEEHFDYRKWSDSLKHFILG